MVIRLIVLILTIMPNLVLAESPSMTSRSLNSMLEAERSKAAVCRRIQASGSTACFQRDPQLRNSMQAKMMACHTRYRQAQCDRFIQGNARYRGHGMNCNDAHDVCRMELQSTLVQGCRQYGLEVKAEVAEAYNRFATCSKSATCMAQSMVANAPRSFMAIINPLGYFAQQAATSMVDQFKSDRDRAKRMECLDPDEAAKITCELLVRYGSMATGVAGAARSVAARGVATQAVRKTATQATAVRATPMQRQGIISRTIARVSPISRSIPSNKLTVMDGDGRMVALDSIQPGESFQALLLRDRSRIVLLRSGNRNGGHQFLANSNYKNFPDSLPDIDPATYPGGGNIRFVVGKDGKWQADIGGRMLSSDNLRMAQEMAEFLRANGIKPRSVTGGRLEGWTRPAN